MQGKTNHEIGIIFGLGKGILSQFSLKEGQSEHCNRIMREQRRVVITGISVCCPNGTDVETFWANTLAGRSGIDRLEAFTIGDGCTRVAGRVGGAFSEEVFGGNSAHRSLDRTYQMALYCVRLALNDGGFTDDKDRSKCALYISSTFSHLGPMLSPKSGRGNGCTEPRSFSFNSLAGRLASRFDLRGGHVVVPTGSVGGCDAVTYGYKLIKAGQTDCAVVGAAEAPLNPFVIAAFGRIGATSTRDCAPQEASCPFDTRRDGCVLAEGAAMLLLEEETAANRRGARILAEISGVGSVNNCFHMTDVQPDGEAIAAACRIALKDGGTKPSEIDFINSHGSSTPQNDIAEAAALKKVFGARIRDIPLTALKSQIGHALSAANAIEMVNTVQSIHHSEIPPTINLEIQDPGCDVTVVAHKKIAHTIRKALKIGSGFSGIHTAILLSRYRN